jgi:molybdopterin-guanine dinucleotide biosynthesis protein A
LSLACCDAEGFVLAGGRSSRMGQDKALLQVGGRQLIQHALDILREAGLEARIAGARSDLAAFAPVIPDRPGESDSGPLGGIYAALSASRYRFSVFLPVDLPMIPPSLIAYLVHHAVVTEAAATVVSVAGFVQTFPAIVDRAAVESLRASLNSGDRNCLKAFGAAGGAIPGGFSVLPLELLVQPGQVRHPQALHAAQWFLNVNTPDDLKLLEDVMGGAGPL